MEDLTKTVITQEELSVIQGMNSDFAKGKMALGDIELQKQAILKQIDELKASFGAHEQMLIQKYGADAVINVQTGEVTKKQD